MDRTFLTEVGINSCLFPMIGKRRHNITFPYVIKNHCEEIFEATNYWNYHHFILLDLIATKYVKRFFLDNFGYMPKMKDIKEKNNTCIKSESDLVNLINQFKEKNYITKEKNQLTLTDNEIKSIPIFENYNSNRIKECINHISNFKFKTKNYPVLTTEGIIRCKNIGPECPYFVILSFQEEPVKVNKNMVVTKRKYLIDLNTGFGNLFLNNLELLNFTNYDIDVFCKLSRLSQLFCRKYIFTTSKTFNFRKSITLLLDRICTDLNIYDKPNVKSQIKNSIEELKTYCFVKDFEITNDTILIHKNDFRKIDYSEFLQDIFE